MRLVYPARPYSAGRTQDLKAWVSGWCDRECQWQGAKRPGRRNWCLTDVGRPDLLQTGGILAAPTLVCMQAAVVG